MRGFLSFLVIIALVFLGWAAYPTAMDFIRSQGWLPPAPKRVVAESTPETAPEPAAPVAPATPAIPATPEPGPTATAPAATDDDLARVIPMPAIKSLEEITANWTKVPERAYPPQVTLKVDTEFPLLQPGNSMKLSAGNNVAPLKLAPDGTLTIAPRAGSSFRATLPVDGTDFKERVTAKYEAGVARIQQGVQARREAERARRAHAAAASPAKMAEAGEVPAGSSEQERYLALMRQSLANGDVKGVTPDTVKEWRWLGYEEVNGTGYWTGAAVIMVKTYFGEFESEAKAFIRGGRVEKWTLPGVEE